MRIQQTVLLILLLLLYPLSVGAEEVSVIPPVGDIHAGESITVVISVDSPSSIAATAFTLVYDTGVFQLTGIQSTFFDTFAKQWTYIPTLPDPPPPANVLVDGHLYSQPVLQNTANGGTMIAAVRVEAGSTDSTMFTLQFAIDSGAPPGLYPITIQPTSLNNVSAGYPAGGQQVPVLVGANAGESDPALAYPVLTTSLVSSSVTLTMLDTDGDGIDDNWEIKYFGNLTTATASTDFDGDGYSDKQEYLHQINGYTDSNGDVFDPKVTNAPGGIGYVGKNFLPAVYMLLLKQ